MQAFNESVQTNPTNIVRDKHGNATGGVSSIGGTPGSKVQLNGKTVAYISESENNRSNEIFERRIRPRGAKFTSTMQFARRVVKFLTERNKARGNSFGSRLTGGKVTSTFIDFNDFLTESADKAVGNVPVINAKPIHHKASSHKYHLHHMMDPNVALKHQVKDFSKRIDKDVDSDIDQFDKPSSKLPDEVSVPTKKSTAQFFAKYKKEREHIHAGEPVDESSHQYTGNEDSWYIDASGQKVQVMHNSDLKNPEDVAKYLKDKNPDDNIGKVMSMKDFLKTQPEKKK